MAFTLVLSATLLDYVWFHDPFEPRFNAPIRGADASIGLALGTATIIMGLVLLYGQNHLRGWRSPTAVAAACLLVGASGFGLQQVYLHNRYADSDPMPRIFRWARDTHDERIAVFGAYSFLQYPLYGEDLSNFVQYVGTREPHGEFTAIRGCAAWRRALNAGHYSYVVTGNVPGSSPDVWTETDPHATLLLRERGQYALFRLHGRLDPTGCSTDAKSSRRR
jgi:hypothetical protein